MAELVCNLSTHGTETRGIRVSGQPGLHKALEASLGYIERPCLKMHPAPPQEKEPKTKQKPQIEDNKTRGGLVVLAVELSACLACVKPFRLYPWHCTGGAQLILLLLTR